MKTKNIQEQVSKILYKSAYQISESPKYHPVLDEMQDDDNLPDEFSGKELDDLNHGDSIFLPESDYGFGYIYKINADYAKALKAFRDLGIDPPSYIGEIDGKGMSAWENDLIDFKQILESYVKN
jgi:hypothetical protein